MVLTRKNAKVIRNIFFKKDIFNNFELYFVSSKKKKLDYGKISFCWSRFDFFIHLRIFHRRAHEIFLSLKITTEIHPWILRTFQIFPSLQENWNEEIPKNFHFWAQLFFRKIRNLFWISFPMNSAKVMLFSSVSIK